MRHNIPIVNSLILTSLTITLLACSGKKKDDKAPEGSADESIITPTQSTTTTLIGEGTVVTSTTTSSSTTIPEVTSTTVGQNSSTTTTNPSTTTTTVQVATTTTLPVTTTTSSSSTSTTTTTIPVTTTTTIPQVTKKLVLTNQTLTTEIFNKNTSFIVELRDSNDNLLTSSNDQVSISSSSNISGTTTKNAVGGVVTFDDIQFRSTGNYQLTFNSNSYSSVSSLDVSVVDGAAGIYSSNLLLWVKADSIKQNNNTPVCSLEDLTLSGSYFAQSNSSLCPTFNSSSTYSLKFEGGKILYTNNALGLSSLNGITIISVSKLSGTAFDQILLEYGENYNSVGNPHAWVVSYNPGWVCNNCVSSSIKGDGYTVMHSDNNSVTLNQLGYSSASFQLNNVTPTPLLSYNGVTYNNYYLYSGTVGAPFYNKVLYLGGRYDLSYYFTGSVSEILIFNKVLNSTELNYVESRIRTKYGL